LCVGIFEAKKWPWEETEKGSKNEKTRTVDEATGGHYLKSGDKLSNYKFYKVVLTDMFVVLPHEPYETDKLIFLRKEVIQPQVPLRLPCYDLVPIVELTFGACLLTVSLATSGPPNFRGLTGGVYKAQEHIHRGMLTRDY
jgi:hypothetical protein